MQRRKVKQVLAPRKGKLVTIGSKISERQPEALSLGTAASMKRTVILKWFDDLEKLLSELNICDVPSHMWNCDESGIHEHFVQGHVTRERGQPCY